MSFIEPWYLLGGLAALIPIAIHLLKLNKPETVAFSTLAFFKELTDTTVKRLNIKRWLLLLFRVLAILALTIVLAQPVSNNRSNAALSGSGNNLWVLIDNSLSTGVSDDNGIRLYRLTEQAKRWIEQLNEDAKVNLNVTHGKWDYNAALAPKEAIELLNQIQPSKGMDFTAVRMKEMMQNMRITGNAKNELNVLHDGQYSALETVLKNAQEQLDEEEITKLKIGYLAQNGQIVNKWVKRIGTTNSWISANKKMNISVEIGQSSIQDTAANTTDVAQKLAVYVNDRMISEQSLSEADQNLSATFTPTKAGKFAIKASITGDNYALDNHYYSVLNVPESLKILWVTDNNKEQDRANSSFYKVLNAANETGYAIDLNAVAADKIPLDRLKDYNVVVIEAVTTWPTYADVAIREYVQQDGGGLWLIPTSTTDLGIWNKKVSAFGLPTFDGLVGEYAAFKRQTSLERIRANHPIFKGMFNDDKMQEQGWSPVIDSPNIYFYYKMSDLSGTYAILQTEERNPLLVEKKLGKGVIWSMAMGFEPAWSDLSIKAIFAPLIFNGINFLNTANESSFFSEKLLDAPIEISSKIALNTNSVRLNDSLRISFVRDQSLGLFSYRSVDPTLAAGFLAVDSLEFGLNTHNWESEANYFDLQQFISQENGTVSTLNNTDKAVIWDKDLVSNLVYEMQDLTQNTASFAGNKSLPIWVWFLLFALLCLLTESLISRYFKVQGARA